MAKKMNYYNPKELLKVDAEYNIILGQRANGKSYAIKAECIRQSWANNDTDKFVYLRRWDIDIKQRESEQYFSDMAEIVKTITDDECDCLTVYQKVIYFGKTSTNGKVQKIKKAGYCMALTQDEHYKSAIYLDVKNIIYEEFITNKIYLHNEPRRLMHFMSTIFRNRKGHLYMIGNTISRVCPYVDEWGLINLHKQQQGTIEVYKFNMVDDEGNQYSVNIAVEYCESLKHASRMFFGQASKNITKGVWETTDKPHLAKSPDSYIMMYDMVVEFDSFKFYCRLLLLNSGAAVWYVEPKTTPIQKGTRVVSNKIHTNSLYTYGFKALAPTEADAFRIMLVDNKVFYSDNLTGTDFETCLLALKNL